MTLELEFGVFKTVEELLPLKEVECVLLLILVQNWVVKKHDFVMFNLNRDIEAVVDGLLMELNIFP